MRPLATIIHDSLDWYGVDPHGGRVHDLLGTRCDPYINTVLAGEQYDFHCHSNLTRAVKPYGLHESDVHDVINIFQATGLDEQGRYFMNPSPAQAGDSIEFLAEQDLLMALSTCSPAPHRPPPPNFTFPRCPCFPPSFCAPCLTIYRQVRAPAATSRRGGSAATAKRK